MMDDPLNILCVHPGNRINGSVLGCIEIAEAAIEAGHNFILATDGEGEAASLAEKKGIRTFRCRIPRWFCGFSGQAGWPRARMLAGFLSGYQKGLGDLEVLIQSEKVQVVLANTSPAVLGVVAGNRAGCPVLCHVRESLANDNRWGRAHARFLAKHSQKVVVNSESSSRPFVGEENWVKVYDGLESPKIELGKVEFERWKIKLCIESGRPIVGVLGSFSSIKGQHLMLQQIPRLVAQVPNVVVVFMGSKPKKQKLSALRGGLGKLAKRQRLDVDHLVDTLGIERNVRFTGWVSDVYSALGIVDVLAFPSIVPEGFGRPLVEAALMRKPVVAFNHGATSEIVDTGLTGLLVPPCDANGFCDAVATLLLNPTCANEMGQNGRCKVETSFSLKMHTEKMINALEKTAKIKVPASPKMGMDLLGLLAGRS